MLPVVTFDEPSNEESVVIDAGHDTHQKVHLPPEGTSVVQEQG